MAERKCIGSPLVASEKAGRDLIDYKQKTKT
jgi:hypothetical protein